MTTFLLIAAAVGLVCTLPRVPTQRLDYVAADVTVKERRGVPRSRLAMPRGRRKQAAPTEVPSPLLLELFPFLIPMLSLFALAVVSTVYSLLSISNVAPAIVYLTSTLILSPFV